MPESGPVIRRRPPRQAVGALLARAGLPTADLAALDLEHFLGCGTLDEPAGVVGIEPLGPYGMIRSLAVDRAFRGSGCGRALVAAAERHARSLGIRELYLLTETAPGFFSALGYEPVGRDVVPDAVRASEQFASICPASAACMRKRLDAADSGGSSG